MQSVKGGPANSEGKSQLIHIQQGNMNRSKTANDLLQQIVREMDIDLLLISEQYRNREDPAWYSDTLGMAAIWIPGKSMTQTKITEAEKDLY